MFKASKKRVFALGAFAGACLFAGSAAAAGPTTLTRTMVVEAMPGEVWAVIGPFCAIKDWHPALASCELDGKAPPTRTLVTREGEARFVELQVARSDANHRYTYSFTSSPVPVSGYVATISVKPSGKGASIVTWQGSYTPNAGQDAAAMAALSGIYESGLAAIRDRFAHN
jgi:hypothetical protein